jgi:hypothetical protein
MTRHQGALKIRPEDSGLIPLPKTNQQLLSDNIMRLNKNEILMNGVFPRAPA